MSAILFLVLILHLVSAGPVPLQTSNVTTWFQPGVDEHSACPKLNLKDDNTSAVALSTEPFANGTACHSIIKIESPELTVYGRVTDLCPEPYCQAGDLNLSPQLFSQFAPLSNGIVTGLRWSFVNRTTSQPISLIEAVIPEVELDTILATSTVPAYAPAQTTTTSWSTDNQATPTPKAQLPIPSTTTISYPQYSPIITTSTSTTDTATMTPKPDPNPFSGHITWYNPSVGIGACGTANTDDDYVIAVNSAQYPGQCGKRITINGNGKQVSATVMDECPTCGYGDLDLSPAVFKNIAGLEVGKLPITWSFN